MALSFCNPAFQSVGKVSSSLYQSGVVCSDESLSLKRQFSRPGYKHTALFSDGRAQQSPFTEKNSVTRNRGGGTLEAKIEVGRGAVSFNDDDGCRDRARSVERTESHMIASLSGGVGRTVNSDPRASSVDEFSGPSYEDDNIDARLPELREVLSLLRHKWAQVEAAGGERQRGPGNVFLVGTGPGDPELLTVKALQLMQCADLVLYDRLVSTDILDLVHAGARLLYVGKTSGYHSRTQEDIHELLLSFAEAGATVLRLKGGDPLVFGRGGEEMDFLQEKGIRVQVVPGITAASGIAAELGIPLTHRGAANSVRFLTGHSRKGGDDPLHLAEQAADPDSTLVIYMGLATLPALAAKLIASGLPPDTPGAAVERGTTAQQRLVFSRLQDLPQEVLAAQLVSPTLVIIGRVVALSYLWPFKSTSGEVKKLDSAVSHNNTSGREPRSRRFQGADPQMLYMI